MSSRGANEPDRDDAMSRKNVPYGVKGPRACHVYSNCLYYAASRLRFAASRRLLPLLRRFAALFLAPSNYLPLLRRFSAPTDSNFPAYDDGND